MIIHGGKIDLSMATMKIESSQGNLVQMRLWQGWMKLAMSQARIPICRKQESITVMENQYGI
jgi:hypothetical protein